MNRFRLFIENFLVYGLGSVISKIVPLIMLPIVTRLIPNTFFYGLNDISNIIISFGTAIAVMGMYDAMFRLFFEKEDEEYKKDICSSAFCFNVVVAIIIFIIMILFSKVFSKVFYGSIEYTNLFMISALSVLIGSTNTIISAPTRMNNKRKIFLITNTLAPIISYSISIPLLIKHMYVIALPIAGLISSTLMLVIFYILNHEWFSIRRFNFTYVRELLKIGLPLMPNFLVYWIFNSADRIMIGSMIGNDYVGIYGIGARIAQVSQFIYMAFAGGWQYFAFSTMNDSDQVEVTSNIFEYLGVISFGATIVFTLFGEVIFNKLFVGDYLKGLIVIPYLFLSPLLLMLFQIACNQFLIIKKTWPNLIILSIGALINLISNYVLIPVIGIEGAAIGTLLGYIFSVIICVILLKKIKLINVSLRLKKCCLISSMYFILWRLFFKSDYMINCFFALAMVMIYIYMYKREINYLIKKIKGN